MKHDVSRCVLYVMHETPHCGIFVRIYPAGRTDLPKLGENLQVCKIQCTLEGAERPAKRPVSHHPHAAGRPVRQPMPVESTQIPKAGGTPLPQIIQGPGRHDIRRPCPRGRQDEPGIYPPRMAGTSAPQIAPCKGRNLPIRICSGNRPQPRWNGARHSEQAHIWARRPGGSAPRF
ncbi:conserved hypothetical protein [Cenarchaeum symbiosum A]|uniref:Uncharacterized protein n=1 Tax=Cenarchaeum symbiosum (strain A) TaxID=414004 RepID=A0RVX3_CENSY|nr:conserved hypothetical protein [Cenarchaeum symbiosum A]